MNIYMQGFLYTIGFRQGFVLFVFWGVFHSLRGFSHSSVNDICE